MTKTLKWILVLLGLTMAVAAETAADEPFVYDDHGKRDPFWPLLSPSGAIVNYDEKDLLFSDMILEGIIAGGDGENVAIINGLIVKEGDQVGSFEVQKINIDSVVIQKGQAEHTLQLKKEE